MLHKIRVKFLFLITRIILNVRKEIEKEIVTLFGTIIVQ